MLFLLTFYSTFIFCLDTRHVYGDSRIVNSELENSKKLVKSGKEISPSVGDLEANLGSALAEAKEIIREAERRARETHEAARQNGYRDGYEQGRKDAAWAAIRLAQDVSSLQSSLNAKVLENSQKVAGRLLEDILRRDPMIRQEVLDNLVKAALALVSTPLNVELHVHPDDEDTVKARLITRMKKAFGMEIALRANQDVGMGSCVVKTELGEIDSSWEALLSGVDWGSGSDCQGVGSNAILSKGLSDKLGEG